MKPAVLVAAYTCRRVKTAITQGPFLLGFATGRNQGMITVATVISVSTKAATGRKSCDRSHKTATCDLSPRPGHAGCDRSQVETSSVANTFNFYSYDSIISAAGSICWLGVCKETDLLLCLQPGLKRDLGCDQWSVCDHYSNRNAVFARPGSRPVAVESCPHLQHSCGQAGQLAVLGVCRKHTALLRCNLLIMDSTWP
jgi:hypothetical protein